MKKINVSYTDAVSCDRCRKIVPGSDLRHYCIVVGEKKNRKTGKYPMKGQWVE